MNNQLKPQDLRYGNLIESQGKIFTVKAIEAFIVTATRGKGNVDFTYAEINPIQLTEEILLMAGFKQSESGNYYVQISDINDYFLNIDSTLTEAYLDTNCTNQVKIFERPIKYLNDLQNFVKTLTGEELEINLK